MKICIFGAGAIGGLMGVQLARAGADVSFIARGPHLAAMRERGARLLMDGEEFSAPVKCTSDPRELGVQDFVIVTLKAHSLPGVVESMQPLLGKHTAIVTGVNGIPYQTAFGSVKFSIAAVPCSRPKPESRTPPHGNRTSV
jgi:2-dehydropantoate 2-reductase